MPLSKYIINHNGITERHGVSNQVPQFIQQFIPTENKWNVKYFIGYLLGEIHRWLSDLLHNWAVMQNRKIIVLWCYVLKHKRQAFSGRIINNSGP